MSDPAALMRTLMAALERQDRAAVNRACRSLIKARAPLAGQWRAIATVLLENDEMTDARRAIDLLVAAARDSPLARFVKAEIYARSGRVGEAYDVMATVPPNIPDPLGNAYVRGTIATNMGLFDEAREHLRHAIGIAPKSGQSWLALTTLGKLSAEETQQIIRVRPDMARAGAAERGAYCYALGKVLHDLGDHDAAFAAFAEGAAIEFQIRPSDPAIDDSVRSAIDDWSAERIASLRRPSKRSTRPIFVTGLPRSGSTLIEQILVSHSRVTGGHELGVFRHILAELGGADIGSVMAAARSRRLDALTDLYEHLLSERFPEAGRIVDKSLQASLYMGVIATLFPDAPVVWVRRDPLDNAWSIFRTYFTSQLGWTFDQRAIARQMLREDRMFDHWCRARPDRILRVDYAELASEPERIIPRIVEHCGLALEPQQLSPHETRRAVTTASVAQVRAPINRNAIGAAAPYRRHLQPFIGAYREGGGTLA